MTVPLVVGAGDVGTHAIRQLAATPGIERILVTDHDADRATSVAKSVGGPVSATVWRPGGPFADGATVVVLAIPAPDVAHAAEAAVHAGLDVVSCADAVPTVEHLVELNANAATTGAHVVAGAGFAPGLSEVLAALAADSLDATNEVHVARCGANGTVRRHAVRRASRRVVPFPPPVGPRDCVRVDSAMPILAARAIGGLERVTVRQTARRWGRATDKSLGALHVEVRGGRGASREILTYGAVDHLAAATGAALACAAAVVSGLAPGIDPPAAGARGFAELAPPRALLGELARRGVRAARFAAV